MEEKQEKKSTKKKTPVVDEAKVREAKKKVNDLLQGTGLEDPTDVFVPPVMSDDVHAENLNNDNATSWLNEQVAGLTQQVDEYEKTIMQLKNDNANLMASLNSGRNSDDVSHSEKAKIVELYKHFENVYTGRNKFGGAFDTAKLSHPQYGTGVLDMFLSTFPYLHEHKAYQHRG